MLPTTTVVVVDILRATSCMVTVANGDTITLSPENSARYAAVMKLVQSTDSETTGSALHPLLPGCSQQAYEDLGYPGQYFNDRLVEVIDHLLQAPDLRGPIELKQGRVFYEYADPVARNALRRARSCSCGWAPTTRRSSSRSCASLRVFVTTSQDAPVRCRYGRGDAPSRHS